MKRIMDGKRYDTATAELIGEWDNGHYRSDFHYCEETLCKTPGGAYFLHGAGGALSPYSQAHGTSRGSGDALQPMTADEAKAWLEEKGLTEALETHFADTIQDA